MVIISQHCHPRILHVLTTPRAEGTPNLVLDWLAAGSRCWQAVLVLHSRPADLTERLRAAADAYEEHDLFTLGLGKFFRIAEVARSAVRRHRPDVVVCWPTGFANWICAGARLAGCQRLLVHAGNPTNRSPKNDWLTRYVQWPLAMLRARVVCCSDYVRDSYRSVPGVPDNLFYTVHNSSRAATISVRAEAARRARSSPASYTAVMVATLERHKDHATLLRAMPTVLTHRQDFRLRLVGHGTLFTELRELSACLGLGESIEFLGTRTDVPELLGGSDLFVFSTTTREGLGSVLLEALAAGLPVIASDVPACRELLAGGMWGRLVTPADPIALAAAIVEAIASLQASDAKKAGIEYASGFTPARMMGEYLAIAGMKLWNTERPE